MDEFSIRPARVEDTRRIGAVGHQAWLKGISPHVCPEVRERIAPKTFELFARTHTIQVIVAEGDGNLFGFAATEDGDNYISDLWVAPDFEGYGVGTALLSALEEIIADRGYGTARLEVLTDNERAVSLYRYLGYGIEWQGMRHDEVLLLALRKTLMVKSV
ncbi:MAG: GNAT family N-acetyltransferase [Hyphomicrobiaceae bacterium]